MQFRHNFQNPKVQCLVNAKSPGHALQAERICPCEFYTCTKLALSVPCHVNCRTRKPSVHFAALVATLIVAVLQSLDGKDSG